MIKRITQKIGDFFKPTEDVRARDVLREVPGAIGTIGRGIKRIIPKWQPRVSEEPLRELGRIFRPPAPREAMRFEVGEGLTPEQQKQAEQKLQEIVRAPRTPGLWRISVIPEEREIKRLEKQTDRTAKQIYERMYPERAQELKFALMTQWGKPELVEEAVKKGKITPMEVELFTPPRPEHVIGGMGIQFPAGKAKALISGAKGAGITKTDILKPQALTGAKQEVYRALTAEPAVRTELQRLVKDPKIPATQNIGEYLEKIIRTTPEPAVPKELEPLAKEARKYKSAEEFVRNYDGGLILDKVEVNKWIAGGPDNTVPVSEILGPEGKKFMKEMNLPDIPVRVQEASEETIGHYAQIEWRGGNRLKDARINIEISPTEEFGVESLGIMEKNLLHELAHAKQITLNRLGIKKIQGEVSEKAAEKHANYILSKTKSQLTDIWNKAQGKPITPEVPREGIPGIRGLREVGLAPERPPTITKSETTLLKDRIRDYARGIREGRIDLRKDAKGAVNQFETFLRESGIPAKDYKKFVPEMRNIATAKDPVRAFSEKFPDIQRRINNYVESEVKRGIQTQIQRELKYTKPLKVGDRRIAKYDYESNKFFEGLRENNKLNQEQSAEKLRQLPQEGLSEMDKINARFLSLKENGMKSSVELNEQVLRDIEEMKRIGREAKDTDDFLKRLNRAEKVDEMSISIDKIKGTEQFINKMQNAYLRGVANTKSMLNAIGGKEMAEKYDPKLLQNKKDTAIFQSERELIRGVSEDLGIDNPKKLYKELINMESEKFPATDVEGLTHEYTRTQLMDIYNSIKNPTIKERYHNAFGENQVNQLLHNLTENEIKAADRMMEQVQKYREILNRRNIEITGRDLGTVENYWPSTAEFQPNVFDDIRLQGETPSAMKARSHSVNVFPRPESAWLKTLKHINQAEHVKHLSRRYEELRRLFTDRKIKKQVIDKFGEKVYGDLMAHVDQISLNKFKEKLDVIGSVIDGAINNWVKAKIVSPTVPARQLGSMSNYAENMPSAEWAKGFMEGLTSPKKTFDYMWKNNPFLEARFNQGYSEALKDVMQGANHLKVNAGRFTSLFTLPVRAGDITAIIYGGYPYFKHTLKKTGSLQKARDAFENATLEAQQAGVSSALSLAQNSPNPAMRTLFRFKNTLNQYLRKTADAIINFRNNEISAGELAKKITLYNVIQPMLYVLIGAGVVGGTKSIGKIMRGEEIDPDFNKVADDILMEMALQPFGAIPIIDDIAEYSYRHFTGKPKYGVFQTPVLDDVQKAMYKMSKKEITLEDYLETFGVAGEVGFGVPITAIIRYKKYLMEEGPDSPKTKEILEKYNIKKDVSSPDDILKKYNIK